MKSSASLFTIATVVSVTLAGIWVNQPEPATDQCFLTLDYECDKTGIIQVFYDIGNGWNEVDSFAHATHVSDRRIHKQFPLPFDATVRGFRIDPSQQEGQTFTLYRVMLTNNLGDPLKVLALDGIGNPRGVSEIHRFPTGLRFQTRSNDSQLYLPLVEAPDFRALIDENSPPYPFPWGEFWVVSGLLLAVLALAYALVRHLGKFVLYVKNRWKTNPRDKYFHPLTDSPFLLAITVFLVILGTVHLVGFALYATRYFFLLDDFVVLRIAGDHSFWQLLAYPHIGFYRPLVFVFFKIQLLMFGWEHPAGYLVVSLGIHALNTFLLGWLVYRLFRSRYLSVMIGVLFFLNPWSGESPLWFCLQSDLLAVTGTLVVLLAGWETRSTERRRRDYLLTPVLLYAAALFACLGKESALTLPAVYGLMLCLRTDFVDLLKRPRLYLNEAAIVLAVITYMLVRSQLIGAFGGAYGNYFDLIRNSNPVYLVRPFFIPPLAHPEFSLYSIFQSLHLFLVFMLLATAILLRPRKSLVLFLMFFFALLPVFNFEIAINSSAGTRWLYLPSVVWILLVATAISAFLHQIQKRKINEPSVFWVLGSSLGLYALLLGNYASNQRANWAKACEISRTAIRQFSEVAQKDTYFYLPNLPHQFEEGSVMIASHVFWNYFGDQRPMYIRGELEILREKHQHLEIADTLPDRWANSAGPQPNEKTVLLDYGIEH